MNLNKKIKCGIIGCGRIFPKHYEIFSKKIIPNLHSCLWFKKKKLDSIKNKELFKSQNYKKLLKIIKLIR